ncbi:MAG TPA: cyclic nucleotide-binding domain-containing protein [Actinomycetota bacterium]|nr:cyclic nucleotide-binding domain-containing protein [Actinomycetota bacterium]
MEDSQSIAAEALREVPLLSGLMSADLSRIARIGKRKRYAAGEPIVTKGTFGGGLFLVVSGTANVDVGGKIHALGPGEFFGEMSLISTKPRSATVTAAESVDVLIIHAVDFKAFLMANPSLAVVLLERMAERLREVQDRIDTGGQLPGAG